MSTFSVQAKDDLLTVEQTGELLHASRATVFRLIRDKRIASIKVGKSRLIRRGAISDFIRREEAADMQASA